MLPLESEKLVLGACLSNPDGKDLIPQRVVHDLETSRFGNPAHQRIFNAVRTCVVKKISPNPSNVAIELKADLEDSGGLEYLNGLAKFPYIFGTQDLSGLPEWVRVVDWNGRARLVHKVLHNVAAKPVEEFQKDIINAADPDAALHSLISEISAYVSGSKSGYKHISEAGDRAIEYIHKSYQGEVVEIIPCGWPNLEKYLIPRPRTYGVICGMPSMGKTQLGLQIGFGIALNLKANNQEGGVFINTFEQVGYRLVNRLACMLAGVNSRDLGAASITQEQKKNLIEKVKLVSDLPIYFDDDPTLTSDQFVTHAVAHSLKIPRIFGMADYAELFKDKGDSEELRISKVSKNLRVVCWETGSCEVLISQVTVDNLRGSYKIAGLFGTRYSRALGADSDWYIEVWNAVQMKRSNIVFTVPDGKDSDYAYILIEKNKDYPVGEEPFEWVPEYTRFRDISLPVGEIYGRSMVEDEF